MNNEQGERLNKMLRIIGYIISGIVVWIYGTKGIIYLLPISSLEDSQMAELYLIVGVTWPIFGVLIANGICHLYAWISTGESKSLIDYFYRRSKNDGKNQQSNEKKVEAAH